MNLGELVWSRYITWCHCVCQKHRHKLHTAQLCSEKEMWKVKVSGLDWTLHRGLSAGNCLYYSLACYFFVSYWTDKCLTKCNNQRVFGLGIFVWSWNIDGKLWIQQTHFIEIWITNTSVKDMYVKLSSAKYWPCCSRPSILIMCHTFVEP